MNPGRLTVSFRAEQAPADLAPAIGVFHRFLQRGAVEGQVLDVADYRHVPRGPGVMLIGHDVDYGIDASAFSVVRKRSKADPAGVQLRDALRLGLGTLDAIAYDGALDVSFDRSRFTVSVPDRGLGDHDEVAAGLRAEVEPVVRELYGADAQVTTTETDDPRRAPELMVEIDRARADAALEALGGARPPGQSRWDVPVEELARLRAEQADFVLLDVREDSERDIVHLNGTHIPLAELGERMDELDRSDHVVVHCRAGHRGGKATEQLRAAGFDDAWNVNGGLIAWIDRIDPSLPRY